MVERRGARVRSSRRLAPQCRDGVADMGDADDEHDDRSCRHGCDTVQRPPHGGARRWRAREPHQSRADAGLDGDGACAVEELGDEEELCAHHDIVGVKLGRRLPGPVAAACDDEGCRGCVKQLANKSGQFLPLGSEESVSTRARIHTKPEAIK